MLGAIPADHLPRTLNTLTDQGGNSLLHLAVARASLPLAELLLGLVGGQDEGGGDWGPVCVAWDGA
jgi:hypothetical protein